MSGHNKWASIKHKKGANDAKRGKLFSKLIKEITVAAKLGGGSLEGNARLKTAVLKAKDNNMPNRNIDNAIKKATDPNEGSDYEEITYEGYGPAGVGILIYCLTDNKNRSVSEVRSTLTKNNGNLGETGSVSWQFEKKGIVNIEKSSYENEDDLMELVLEAGADDMIVEDEGYTIKTEPEGFLKMIDQLKEKNIEIANSELTMYPKNFIEIDNSQNEKLQKLVDLLDDLDDVQTVSTNEEIK